MTQGPSVTGVMICGAGHSGSTLLGLILGRAKEAFYMGEGGKVRYLNDLSKPLRKRACKVCGESCPIWSGFTWDQTLPLYEQVARHTDARVIIDSTKDARWISSRTAELKSAGNKAVLIFLKRDGRAVLNSRFRKYPEKDAETQIRSWMEQISASQKLFDDFEGAKLAIQYEQLAVEPEGVISGLCDLIGLKFSEDMLAFSGGESHPLGGNTGTQFVAARDKVENDPDAILKLTPRTHDYYTRHDGQIRLDMRWKSEMSATNLALFNELAGAFNAPMAWEN